MFSILNVRVPTFKMDYKVYINKNFGKMSSIINFYKIQIFDSDWSLDEEEEEVCALERNRSI